MKDAGILEKAMSLSKEELELEYLRVVRENEYFRRHIHGQKSEKYNPAELAEQLTLELGEVGKAEDPPEMEKITYQRKKKKKKPNHPGRHPLPAHLPRREIHLEPEEDVTGLKEIGEDVTETLDFIPAKFIVNRYIRKKYAKPNGDGVIMAQLPARPIDKGIPEAGLLSSIICDKYLDHIPLYRQIQRFKRAGVPISDSTINGWLAKVAVLLWAMFVEHRKQVLTRLYLQSDDTGMKVLDRNSKHNIIRGALWAYYAPVEKLAYFDYRTNKSREGPDECLANFQGHLQTDGAKVYNRYIHKQGIVMYNCMAHARRKFFEAGVKNPKVAHAMEVFGKLYQVESEAREQGLDPEARRKLRQERSFPVWMEFKGWMIETWPLLTPQSKLRGAIEYTLARWKELGKYILCGEIEIDNNLVENQIRPIALGRKNYLFSGSHEGAQRSAMFYSLLGTCKMHGIDPYQWLKEVLQKLPDYPVSKVAELLPQNWLVVEEAD